MPISTATIYECQSDACRFRFPVTEPGTRPENCPCCGSSVKHVATVKPDRGASFMEKANAQPHVDALLDNIRSVYNVGSIFRTADGAGIGHLSLCGITTTPDHRGVAKTALGAETAVSWSCHPNGLERARELKHRGFELYGLEDCPAANSLFSLLPGAFESPIVLVIGNEIAGIDPDILGLCDRVLRIPMHGRKRSLNVAVAFGIAAYFLKHGIGVGEVI